jgi:hypothetical protein
MSQLVTYPSSLYLLIFPSLPLSLPTSPFSLPPFNLLTHFSPSLPPPLPSTLSQSFQPTHHFPSLPPSLSHWPYFTHCLTHTHSTPNNSTLRHSTALHFTLLHSYPLYSIPLSTPLVCSSRSKYNLHTIFTSHTNTPKKS